MNHGVMLCPHCGEDLEVIDVTADSQDVFGCEDCGYDEREEQEEALSILEGFYKLNGLKGRDAICQRYGLLTKSIS